MSDKVWVSLQERIAVVLLFAFLAGGCAGMNGGEVGEGLKVSGIGSGSPGLTLVGLITEPLGRWIMSPFTEQTEKEKVLGDGVYTVLRSDFFKTLDPSFTRRQVQKAAESYCSELRRKAAAKEPLDLSRDNISQIAPADAYIPTDEDISRYLLEDSRFASKCPRTLGVTGFLWVSMNKKKLEAANSQKKTE